MEKSDDYHDYVIKNGKLIGQFEEMYQNSKDIPWHQDITAHEIFTDIDIAILKYFAKKFKLYSIAEIGCGLGFVTSRIHNEVALPDTNSKTGQVSGFDISKTAISKAIKSFPSIQLGAVRII